MGARDVGPMTDVYGLGAVLYELLVGHAPFGGLSIVEMIRAINDDDPPAPRRLVPNCPRELEAICLKCLEKSPSHRYASARLLSEDLRRYLRREPVFAQPPSWLQQFTKLSAFTLNEDRIGRWAGALDQPIDFLHLLGLANHRWMMILGRVAHDRKMTALERFWPLTQIRPAVEKYSRNVTGCLAAADIATPRGVPVGLP